MWNSTGKPALFTTSWIVFLTVQVLAELVIPVHGQMQDSQRKIPLERSLRVTQGVQVNALDSNYTQAVAKEREIRLANGETAKLRIVLLRSPAFRDKLKVDSFSRQSEGTVKKQREEFKSKAVREQDTLLSGLRQKLYNVDASSGQASTRGFKKVHSYSEVVNGFSLVVTEREEKALKDHPSVLSISPDKKVTKTATRSPTYLGLNNSTKGVWRNSTGTNVVIGVIDTGIWPQSLSFSETGMTTKPSTFTGICETGSDSTFKCNKKLVGARFFGEAYAEYEGDDLETVVDSCGDYYSPRDMDGHGTAMASIAASARTTASFRGVSAGEIRGVAYSARVAAYKVFWCDDSGNTADIIAAIDAAVSDGVGVLSLSLSSGAARPGEYGDAYSYALYKAALAGVPPVLSAGNSGPDAFSVANGAPWMMTVGAGTLDRTFQGKVVLPNGVAYKGSAFFSKGTPYISSNSTTHKLYPLIAGTTYSSAEKCRPDSLSSTYAGKIVVCYWYDYSPVAMAKEVLRVGGVGIVYSLGAESDPKYDSLSTRLLPLPGLRVTGDVYVGLLTYIDSTTNPRAYLTPTQTLLGKSTVEAPVVAAFSSSGPNGGAFSILKPDVIAPGYDIITAHSQSPYASGGGSPWSVGSGTSPACPFVAGTVALLKAKYPKWTTSMYFSAITTTATFLNNQNKPIQASKVKATPFQIGSGQVNPNSAINPGLVYALPTTTPYKEFICSIEAGYPYEILEENCGDTFFYDYTLARNLNLPSVVFYKALQLRALTTKRTLTNVGPAGKYTASISQPAGARLTVSPATLTFTAGQKQTYAITMNATSASSQVPGSSLTTPLYDYFAETTEYSRWTFGSITWVGDKGHRVRIVVAINSV